MKGNRTIGIVREVYSKWERRCPFTPDNVRSLVDKGLRVLVQPCNKRVFADQEFERAGAELADDLDPACAIFGVKQVPIENLLPDRTYVFFSHVIKAQQENMALLDSLLEQNIRMIDYECITEGGKRSSPRLVAFGKYAGNAGMINSFRGLGERLLALGYSTPFLNMHAAYQYNSLDHACSAVRDVGQRLLEVGSPSHFNPLVVTFTGNGNCSQGAQEVFAELGDAHEFVSWTELPALVEAGEKGEIDNRKLYGCVVDADSMVTPKQPGAAFNLSEYFEHPERYDPTFHEHIAPYTSVLMNCGYWDARYPRLLTIEQQKQLIDEGRSRLLVVGDVSCDIGGSVEFLAQDTQIEQPFFLYDFEQGGVAPYSLGNMDDAGLQQVLMMGVDILPSELPREASAHFGNAMLPFVPALASSDVSLPYENQLGDKEGQIPAALWGGVICAHGSLAPNFEYIAGMRKTRWREQQQHAAFVSASAQRQIEGSMVFNLQGHLFDTGLINQVLDLIELEDGCFDILQCNARPNVEGGQGKITSNALVQVTFDGGRAHLDQVMEKLKALVAAVPGADGQIEEMPKFCKGNYSRTMSMTMEE